MSNNSGPIITRSGLVLNLDAVNTKCYPGTGTTCTDLSNNGNNGTFNSITYNSSSSLSSFGFNGNTSYITMTENSGMTPQVLTIETVFQVVSTTNTTVGAPATAQYIAFRQNTRTDRFEGYTLNYDEALSQLGITTGTSSGTQYTVYSGYKSIVVGTIYHVGIVFDTTTMYIYINGLLINSGPKASGIDYNATHKLTLGRAAAVGSSFDAYFNGNIHIYRMYNRALSAAEIQQNLISLRGRYNLPIPNEVMISLDAANTLSYSGSGTTWNDLSGNNNYGTLNNTTYDSSSTLSSFAFDGTNSYVTITETSGMYSQILTIEMVFKVVSTTNTNTGLAPSTVQYIAFRQNSRTTNFEGYTVIYDETNQRIVLAAATSGGTTYSVNGSNNSVLVGNIYHVVAVFDTTTMYVYVNGTLSNSGPKVNGIDYNTTQTLTLGRTNASGITYDAPFNGNIYTFKMYNRVLSGTEVSQKYTDIQGRFGI